MFSEKLRKLRLSKGMTQSQLANSLGIAKSTVSMYENGNREPDFEMLEAIADIFNVDLNSLVSNNENITNKEEIAKVALFGGSEEVTDEMWNEVKNYVEFIKQRNKRNEG